MSITLFSHIVEHVVCSFQHRRFLAASKSETLTLVWSLRTVDNRIEWHESNFHVLFTPSNDDEKEASCCQSLRTFSSSLSTRTSTRDVCDGFSQRQDNTHTEDMREWGLDRVTFDKFPQMKKPHSTWLGGVRLQQKNVMNDKISLRAIPPRATDQQTTISHFHQIKSFLVSLFFLLLLPLTSLFCRCCWIVYVLDYCDDDDDNGDNQKSDVRLQRCLLSGGWREDMCEKATDIV